MAKTYTLMESYLADPAVALNMPQTQIQINSVDHPYSVWCILLDIGLRQV